MKSFYEIIDQFDVERLVKDYGAGSIGHLIYPKNKKYTIDVEGKPITINFKLGTTLPKVGFSGFKVTFVDYKNAIGHIIFSDTVKEKVLAEGKPLNALMTSNKIIVDPDVPRMDEGSALKRRALLVCISYLINNEDCLKGIYQLAPKKKNGSLHKNRVSRIVSSAMIKISDDYIFGDHSSIEIFAKADGDDSLSILADARAFDEEKLYDLDEDYISSNWANLGLGDYVR